MIQKQTAKKIIIAFRTSCLKRYPDDIDPLSTEERRKRLGNTEDDPLLAAFLGGLVDDPIDSLGNILASPRLLKFVLRRVDHAWDTLHGEIDFDDLLVVHALQYSSKEVYTFLLNNLKAIRNLGSGDNDAHEHDRRAPLKQLWEQNVGTADAGSGETLLTFLFPWWKREGHGSKHEIPQGVRHATPTDYWIRIQSEDLSAEPLRDQTILNAVRVWFNDHNKKVFNRLNLSQLLYSYPEAGKKIEHFPNMLAGDKIRNLASELFEIILGSNGNRSCHEICDSFINLWRMSLRHRWDGHEVWATAEICKALPVSLRFANDIYYYWRHRDEGEVRTKPPHPEIRNAVVAEAKRIWEGELQTLIQSIDPTFSYNLYYFVNFYSDPEIESAGFVARDWRWFGDLVLRASIAAPDLVLPQMAPFLVHQPDSSIRRFELRVESCRAMFGTGFRDLMQLLAERLKPAQLEPREQSQVEFLHRAAAEWLATEKQPPTQDPPATDCTDQQGSELTCPLDM